MTVLSKNRCLIWNLKDIHRRRYVRNDNKNYKL